MDATPADELFGSPSKTALMKRRAALWSLVRNDPRYEVI